MIRIRRLGKGGTRLAGGLGVSPDSGVVILGVSASTCTAGHSHAVGSFTLAAATRPASFGGPRLKSTRPKRQQKMHQWGPVEIPQIKGKAASTGAAAVSAGRAKWLLLVKGKAASTAGASRAQASGQVVDIELQEFMLAALQLAA